MNENKDIKSLVLEKIQTGKVNMRPHYLFMLQVISLFVVSMLTLLISALLVSFIIFSLIGSGKLFLLGFGWRGFWMFFTLFPWPLLVIEIAFIILLEWLIKKFKFGYRTSLSRLVFVILMASIVISIIIGSTPLHGTLLRRAERRNLPLIGDYYRGIRRPPMSQEIFRGTVSDVGTSSFVLNQASDNDDGILSQRYLIQLPAGVPANALPSFGDTVFVAGHLMMNNAVQAYGFQAFSSPDTE